MVKQHFPGCANPFKCDDYEGPCYAAPGFMRGKASINDGANLMRGKPAAEPQPKVD